MLASHPGVLIRVLPVPLSHYPSYLSTYLGKKRVFRLPWLIAKTHMESLDPGSWRPTVAVAVIWGMTQWTKDLHPPPNTHCSTFHIKNFFKIYSYLKGRLRTRGGNISHLLTHFPNGCNSHSQKPGASSESHPLKIWQYLNSPNCKIFMW